MATDINALLERAGCPKVKDTVPQYKWGSRKSGAYIANIENLYLVCRKHRLALLAALEKVLDERDAAINCLQDESNCAGCKWDSEYNDPESPCLFCKRGWEDETEDYYTWRGPEPTKEEDNGDK